MAVLMFAAVGVIRADDFADRTFQCILDPANGGLTSIRRAEDPNRVEFIVENRGSAPHMVVLSVEGLVQGRYLAVVAGQPATTIKAHPGQSARLEFPVQAAWTAVRIEPEVR